MASVIEIRKLHPAALPLGFERLQSVKKSNQLAFALAQMLGTLDKKINTQTLPKVEDKRRMDGVFAVFSAKISQSVCLELNTSWQAQGFLVANRVKIGRTLPSKIGQNQQITRFDAIHFFNHFNFKMGQSSRVVRHFKLQTCAFIPVDQSAHIVGNSGVHYVACVPIQNARNLTFLTQNRAQTSTPVLYKTCIDQQQSGRSLGFCQTQTIKTSLPVPCRYYPVPDFSDTLVQKNVCRIRPPSKQLPLSLTKKRVPNLGSHVPMPLICWHDVPPPSIPIQRSYLMHNTIFATFAGIEIDPLSFVIKTDIESYCWQAQIELTTRDYAKISEKLKQNPHESMVTVVVNGTTFAFIVEEQRRNRQFAYHSHHLSGRSVSAKLGSDYAKAQSGLVNQATYASQLVHQQLANLPFEVDEWQIADWLIPADQYSVTGKTPIAVINDIARAAGGFLTSDKALPKLSLKPRWKQPAWQLSTANPDVIIAMDVIRQIDEQKRTNPYYNTVMLVGQMQAGIVYREKEGRDKEAPSEDNVLYTDQAVIIPAGIAKLSDSGVHTDYTLTLRWAKKYHIPLAELGQIWQINDDEGFWRGVVNAVSVSVKVENGVPIIWQTVGLDRYCSG